MNVYVLMVYNDVIPNGLLKDFKQTRLNQYILPLKHDPRPQLIITTSFHIYPFRVYFFRDNATFIFDSSHRGSIEVSKHDAKFFVGFYCFFFHVISQVEGVVSVFVKMKICLPLLVWTYFIYYIIWM